MQLMLRSFVAVSATLKSRVRPDSTSCWQWDSAFNALQLIPVSLDGYRWKLILSQHSQNVHHLPAHTMLEDAYTSGQLYRQCWSMLRYTYTLFQFVNTRYTPGLDSYTRYWTTSISCSRPGSCRAIQIRSNVSGCCRSRSYRSLYAKYLRCGGMY